jgi:hypothetical protein
MIQIASGRRDSYQVPPFREPKWQANKARNDIQKAAQA